MARSFQCDLCFTKLGHFERESPRRDRPRGERRTPKNERRFDWKTTYLDRSDRKVFPLTEDWYEGVQVAKLITKERAGQCDLPEFITCVVFESLTLYPALDYPSHHGTVSGNRIEPIVHTHEGRSSSALPSRASEVSPIECCRNIHHQLFILG
jgi:hypothetical protein